MKSKDILTTTVLFLSFYILFNYASENKARGFFKTKISGINQADFYFPVRLNGVKEFLNKLGFVIEKRFPQEIFSKAFYKLTLFKQKLYPLKHYIYIRSLFNKERVDIFEFDNKNTPDDEMIGDVVLIFSKNKIIDFRYYNPTTKTKHIWYNDEPAPCLPVAGSDSKYSVIENSLL